LKALFADWLARQGHRLEAHDLQGHPERPFDPKGQYAVPHVLLVGDAAGVDPLLGEGIAYALMYGPIAAQAIADAFQRGDFRFTDYRQRLLCSPLGHHLQIRVRLARFCYARGRTFMRLGWPLLGLALRCLARRLKRNPPSGIGLSPL